MRFFVRHAPRIRQSYIICTDRRSGSTLLSEALRKTGIAGMPAEYFNPHPATLAYRKKYLNVTRDEQFLEKLIEKSTSQNGVFGTKIHAYQLPLLVSRINTERGTVVSASQAAVLAARFPNLTYIWLRRENAVRQAISLYRAFNTGAWWQFAEKAPPMYRQVESGGEKEFNAEAIETYFHDVRHNTETWKRFFTENGIAPLELTYEELSADYIGVIRRTLRHLGLPDNIPIPPPQTKRQADARTDEWERRFRELRLDTAIPNSTRG